VKLFRIQCFTYIFHICVIQVLDYRLKSDVNYKTQSTLVVMNISMKVKRNKQNATIKQDIETGTTWIETV
jgi:hypothetical protein